MAEIIPFPNPYRLTEEAACAEYRLADADLRSWSWYETDRRNLAITRRQKALKLWREAS